MFICRDREIYMTKSRCGFAEFRHLLVVGIPQSRCDSHNEAVISCLVNSHESVGLSKIFVVFLSAVCLPMQSFCRQNVGEIKIINKE